MAPRISFIMPDVFSYLPSLFKRVCFIAIGINKALKRAQVIQQSAYKRKNILAEIIRKLASKDLIRKLLFSKLARGNIIKINSGFYNIRPKAFRKAYCRFYLNRFSYNFLSYFFRISIGLIYIGKSRFNINSLPLILSFIIR